MTILQKVEEHIFQIHKDTLSSRYTYHNFNHTLRVVNGLEEILKHHIIDEKEALLLRYAAWFHDVGYTNSWEGHEERSAQIARTYLLEQGVNENDITLVMELIRATKLDYNPKTDLECIIKDADFAHFADDNYIDTSHLLKNEIELCCGKVFTELEWNEQNRDVMLYKHRYYTSYAQQNWQPQKQKNLQEILKIIDKLKKKGQKKQKAETNRTIDTLFRTTLRNHTQLSAIADRKANILLSVNAIIISICLSTLIPKLDSPSNAHLIYPTFILLMFSVATVIFAILSTRPKITSGKFTKEQVTKRQVNLLFFGTFHQMPYQEYEDTLMTIMKDNDYLYHALTKDLYSLGVVLNKKYKLLNITYTVFTIGILASVIAFVYAFRAV
ncbi:Pycsar system effector family protein [Myroides pelagicus]|uniref:HD domain-containing protein n=1 Tax=Myroides pelagicus TaxID=270914 RepID=A0A7K1GLS8_9FLAO|nr:Pycsar system effector family protein [Myroides pelagicus]MEC4112633.1 Pycsar system effector family protein [Myroides pelagicus]MTH29489.1 HD domain-containing protein [Myroides pelagicus]